MGPMGPRGNFFTLGAPPGGISLPQGPQGEFIYFTLKSPLKSCKILEILYNPIKSACFMVFFAGRIKAIRADTPDYLLRRALKITVTSQSP